MDLPPNPYAGHRAASARARRAARFLIAYRVTVMMTCAFIIGCGIPITLHLLAG